MNERTPRDESALAWSAEQEQLERTHRPLRLDEFIGQRAVVANLGVAVQAAAQRGEALDHVLLCGPPGLGKTTLAGILAQELGTTFERTSGPVLERPKDLAAILANLERGAVLFIDEIHRLPTTVEEVLYPAMEDFEIDVMIGEGPGARSVKLPLQPFTLVGATTRTQLISRPLRDRFGLFEQLDYYEARDLIEVLMRYAEKLSTTLTPDAAKLLAERAQGTPRVALARLRRVRDYAEVYGESPISAATAAAALNALGIDELGLKRLDRRFLQVLIEHYDGGPTGLRTLAAAIGEDPRTLEEVVEPYLIRQGLIDRTPRGRIATRRAVDHVRESAFHDRPGRAATP